MPRTARLLAALALPALLAAAGCAGRGREVYLREGCGSCHRFRDLGGGGAPDLTDIGERRDAAWIRRQIRDPRANEPRGSMPAFPRITPGDLRALVSLLTSR